MEGRIHFRKATKEDDGRIHRFNHQVFAQEIKQHANQDNGELIDKFHDKNIYFIAELDGQIVGMICVHYTPPFSIEEKCPDFKNKVDDYNTVAEVRLFAIDPNYRKKGMIAWTLIYMMVEFLRPKGINNVAISGIEAQRKTYIKIGFEDVGPPVQSGDAVFYPMVLTRKRFLETNDEKIKEIGGLISKNGKLDMDLVK